MTNSNPSIEITPVEKNEQYIINNLYPLFIHDLWAYSDTLPNAHGVIASARRRDGCAAQTLKEQSEMLSPYWDAQAGLESLIIKVDARPAGFCLLQGGQSAPAHFDYCLDEFFLAHPYRGHGIGQYVIEQALTDRPGAWCLDIKYRNKPAIVFWRKVIARIANGTSKETMQTDEYGKIIQMQFSI